MTTKGQERKISKEKKKINEDKPKRTGGTNQEHKEHTRSRERAREYRDEAR